MTASALEALLARIYVDPAERLRFIADPVGEARRAGLSESEAERLRLVDVVGIRLAARSFERKRARAHSPVL